MIAELEEVIEEYVEEKEKMPSLNHSFICAEIIEQLAANKKYKALPELTLKIGKGITPDICVYFREQIKPDFLRDFIMYPEMPLLAIEVISASQNIQRLLEKAERLVKNGVNTVWTVEPFTNTIFITDSKGTKKSASQIIESDGIAVDFQKIFG
jgi:Uma2 family endonuclease